MQKSVHFKKLVAKEGRTSGGGKAGPEGGYLLGRSRVGWEKTAIASADEGRGRIAAAILAGEVPLLPS